MDKTSLFLLLAALLYTCDGSGASWLPSFQSAMKRQARDVDAATEYNSTIPIVHPCERANDCIHKSKVMVTFGKVMQHFKLSEVYPNIGILCSPRPDCRIFGCNTRWVNASIELFDNVFGWICNNQTGFRDAENCFQPPFSERVSSCLSILYDQHHDGNTRAVLQLFQSCVQSEVAGLTTCTEEDKTFFLAFFNYAIEEQLRVYKPE